MCQGHAAPPEPEGTFDCSHALRLSGREWLVIGVVLLSLAGFGPTAWEHIEPFHPSADYRVPYALSNDYWLYTRFCRQACTQEKVLLVGDSVVWGHYVAPDQTLAHYLNELAGRNLFANLGLDGTHPAALEGLVRYYGVSISGRTVVLHLNPLWMTSSKHDLQTSKEFHFNHPELVAQFSPQIPCYKASVAKRIGIAVRRRLPLSRWTAHTRAAYLANLGLPQWTLAHPYANPLATLGRALPEPAAAEEAPAAAGRRTTLQEQTLAWVDLDSSLQWRFFRRTIHLLRRRGNHVFVLIGPYNEHMLTDESKIAYARIRSGVERWLKDNGVAFLAPPPLPAEHYVDASHPIGEGYALLAKTLSEDPSFRSLTTDGASTEKQD